MSWHEEKTAHSLGQLVGGQSLELPRASCREGGDARALSATSQKTLLPGKTELPRREPM
jgi:hypothetical protein